MNSCRSKIILIGLFLALATMACSVTLFSTPTQDNKTSNMPTASAVPTPVRMQLSNPTIITDEDSVLIELYRRSNPAVVNVITYGNQGNLVVPNGQGSGFLYDTLGHFITNAHVVYNAQDLEVVFYDNTILRAQLVGQDPHSDLAVIKVDGLPADIQPIPLGDLSEVSVGQTVVAIGNPFGLGGTLTKGIVSSLGRTIPALTEFSIPQSIQTDAPINPGNSGGPLLNIAGEVVGVNAQIETTNFSGGNSGVGFAIPVSIIKRVIPDLIKNGKYVWAWFGVRGTSLTPDIVEAMNLPVNKGAYIIEVLDGGPSAKAGLQGASRESTRNGRPLLLDGDVITAINGEQVNSFDDLLIYIAVNAGPGDTVTLTILRNGESSQMDVTLEPRDDTLANPFIIP